MIGLIENEIERDLSQRTDMSEATTDVEEVAEEHTEQQEEAIVSDCESVFEKVGENTRNGKAPFFRTVLPAKTRTRICMKNRMKLRMWDVYEYVRRSIC